MTSPDPLLLALACYRFPDADTGQERRMLRFDAARELRRLRAARAGDICPASGTHDGEPFVSQELQCLAGGVGGHVVDLGEVVSGGESLSGRKLSAGDPASQVFSDLDVGRGCRAMIDHGGMLPYLPGDRRFTVRHGGPAWCYPAHMGPDQPGLRAVGGTDHAVDQVKRCRAFLARHPEIEITPPQQNGAPVWEARWPAAEGETELGTHDTLKWLLDYLEERFGQ